MTAPGSANIVFSGNEDQLFRYAPAPHTSTSSGSPDEFGWQPIIYFYCLYIAIIFAGGLIRVQTADLGGAVFLVMLYVRYGPYLTNLRLSIALVGILAAIVFSVIPVFSLEETVLSKTWHDLVKYWSLYLVLLLGLCLPLTPLQRSGRAGLLYGVVLLFLVTGWIMSRAMGDHDARIKGFLVNPNVFAMAAMMLLFLIDDKRWGPVIRTANHLMVLTLIYVTHTSGALIGYAAGMVYRFVHGEGGGILVRRSIYAVVIAVTAAAVFMTIPANTFRAVDQIVEKIKVARENVDRVSSGKEIAYYEIIQKEGSDVTSGAWRLDHWHRIWKKFWDSDMDKILFGYGIGVTPVLFGLKAHNDYLRLLFETGIVGLSIFLVIWASIYRNMDVQYRWVVVMVAVYCLTENNYDHFPSMSLLALYALGAGKQRATADVSRDGKEPRVPEHCRTGTAFEDGNGALGGLC